MDTLMSEASQKCRPTTCVVSPNVISLLELEGGVLPCSLPDGQVTSLCGQGVVLASLSHQQEKGLEQQTSGISGPCSLNSSASADLSMSLGNRLRQRLGMGGLMEYRQTWKQKVTPAGRPYWAHTALAHRTSGRDCIGWPTPVVNDTTGSTHCYSGKNPDGSNKIALKLPGAAKMVGWPTTQARDWKGPQGRAYKGEVMDLPATAQMAGWPTPNAEDAKAGQSQAQNRQQSSLPKTANWVEVVQLSGPLPSGIHAETGKPVASRLNPLFSLWLMGYLVEWGYCGERAMQSFRKLRRSL